MAPMFSNPHNTTIKSSFFSNQNIFLVPGHPPMPWEPANVPHGVIHHHFYQSKIVGVTTSTMSILHQASIPAAIRSTRCFICYMVTAMNQAHGRGWERPTLSWTI